MGDKRVRIHIFVFYCYINPPFPLSPLPGILPWGVCFSESYHGGDHLNGHLSAIIFFARGWRQWLRKATWQKFTA